MRLNPTAGQQQYLASIGVPPLTAMADTLNRVVTVPPPRARRRATRNAPVMNASAKPVQPVAPIVRPAPVRKASPAVPRRAAAKKADSFSPKAAGWIVAAAGLFGFIVKLLWGVLIVLAIPLAELSAQDRLGTPQTTGTSTYNFSDDRSAETNRRYYDWGAPRPVPSTTILGTRPSTSGPSGPSQSATHATATAASICSRLSRCHTYSTTCAPPGKA